MLSERNQMDKPKDEAPRDTQVEAAQKEINEVLDKHEVALVPELTFPRYTQPPEEVQLALAVIIKHEPWFNVVLSPKKQDK